MFFILSSLLEQGSLLSHCLSEAPTEESVYAQGLSEVLTDFSEPQVVPLLTRAPVDRDLDFPSLLNHSTTNCHRRTTSNLRFLLSSCVQKWSGSPRATPIEVEDDECSPVTRACNISFRAILQPPWRNMKIKSTSQMATTMKTRTATMTRRARTSRQKTAGKSSDPSSRAKVSAQCKSSHST